MIWFFFLSSREFSLSNKTACYGVAVLRGVILLETCTSTIDIFCKLRAGGGGGEFWQGPKEKVFFLGEGHSFLKGGEWIIQIFPAHFFNRPPLACLHLNIWTQPSMLVLPHFDMGPFHIKTEVSWEGSSQPSFWGDLLWASADLAPVAPV